MRSSFSESVGHLTNRQISRLLAVPRSLQRGALADNALAAKRAGMVEDHRAVVMLKMPVQAQPRPTPAQQTCQSRLGGLQRFAPQILTVQFEQVEGEQEHAAIVAPLAQPLEHREALLVADDRLTVDQA
jgi:hypothetical protein